MGKTELGIDEAIIVAYLYRNCNQVTTQERIFNDVRFFGPGSRTFLLDTLETDGIIERQRVWMPSTEQGKFIRATKYTLTKAFEDMLDSAPLSVRSWILKVEEREQEAQKAAEMLRKEENND